MSFADIGTAWYAPPTSALNGRADFLRGPRPEALEDGAGPEEAEGPTPAWLLCALAGEALHELCGPVVADRCGRLLGKEALVRALLQRQLPEHLSHLRSLRHVCDVSLRRSLGVPLCPVTGDDLRAPSARPVLLRPCHCVVSALALGAACEACGRHVEEALPLGRAPQGGESTG
eukprot:CAMPEP_0176304076 /NCGR_PEP_ID=MMETSP0121_2-20121125/62243_1 /TAXON_ID=160619 /ORGANISM="Kryptoperidinium foliaceum, Strain CCMP 1326" /LENGTH=173 /DNA_ID=CAMNT_0017645669 /DNA_START=31 /DNA_END=548 /DNA_ORIENTATION=+